VKLLSNIKNKLNNLNSKVMKRLMILSISIFMFVAISKSQVYNKAAGSNIIYEESVAAPRAVEAQKDNINNDLDDDLKKTDLNGVSNLGSFTNTEKEQKVEDKSIESSNKGAQTQVKSDYYGNAQGNQYDLAVDGAFEGETVAVIQLYGSFSFDEPEAALKEKGFSVYRWIGNPPSAKDLETALEKSCELWIISDSYQKLTAEHLKVIKKYFDDGHGVYIWGDNDPYYADANYVAQELIGVSMHGNLDGGQNVGLMKGDMYSDKPNLVGLMPNHLITTGLQNVFEGITIATIDANNYLTPLIYGSAGNLVTAVYEKDGKRLILDGGFTRLYCSWETAGTGRYVKNAAAWLVNYEKFGGEEKK